MLKRFNAQLIKMASNNSIEVNILNQEEVERLWPLLLYLASVVITGIPGNIIVCIVYRRNAAHSNSQFFLMWLAVIDCFTCFMVFLEIVNVLHQYTYQWTWLCKFTVFLIHPLSQPEHFVLSVLIVTEKFANHTAAKFLTKWPK